MTVEGGFLTIEALGALRVESLEGAEGMNMLPAWTVTVLSEDGNVDLDKLLAADALLELGDEQGTTRQIALMVGDAAYAGETPTGHRYELRLTAPPALLRERSGFRVFLDKSARQIVNEVLTDAGVSADGVEWRLTEQLAPRAQCVQYGETDWDFVERLFADEGVSYWLDTDEGGKARLVLGDSSESHDRADGEAFQLDDGSGLRATAPCVFRFERTSQLTEESVHVRDYDIDHPDVLVEGTSGDGALEHYEYPAWVADTKHAERRAKVRLDALQRFAEVATAESHSVRFVPGRVVKVSGIDDAFDGDYLVVRVEHELAQATRHAKGAKPYRARALLTPHDGKRVHRPALPARVPRVDGLETAVVTGPPGEEIHVDPLGRTKVALPWDPSGKKDDTTSAWVRTIQMNMDGSMILPRMGMEMALAYRDGRPDMPMVLGRTYNGASKPPYGLPGKKATMSFMSGTSPGGDSVNEICMSDDAGSQQFAVQASGDQGVAVGGNLTTTVGANEKHSVKANLTEHVKGAQTVSVGANQTITVGSGSETKVDGARTVIVGGSESIGVDGNRVLDCASATEIVGGLYFLRCNLAADTHKASFLGLVGGALGVAAGCGTTESVLGARSEVCGGPRLVTSAMFEDKTYGAKVVDCGAHVLKASGPLVTKVTGAAAIQGGAAKIKGGSGLVIEAAKVTVNAASLSVSGGTSYKLAGTHSASANVNLDNSTATYKAATKAKG